MFWHMLQYAGYLIVAALVGLFVGWLIWARKAQAAQSSFEARAKEMRQELMARRQETEANAAELERLRNVETLAAAVPATKLEPVADAILAGPKGAAVTGDAEISDDVPGDVAPQGLIGDVSDDLTRIEGIGPKMGAALVASGIGSFTQLSSATEETLSKAIEAAGMSFAPSLVTWAKQAKFLVDGDESGFKTYTDRLVAGREPEAN